MYKRQAQCQCAEDCGGRCQYRLLAQGAKTLSVGKAQLAKDGKGICGDSGETVLLREGKQLLLLSDGMGVGLRASKESSAAINMLSRLLEADVYKRQVDICARQYGGEPFQIGFIFSVHQAVGSHHYQVAFIQFFGNAFCFYGLQHTDG